MLKTFSYVPQFFVILVEFELYRLVLSYVALRFCAIVCAFNSDWCRRQRLCTVLLENWLDVPSRVLDGYLPFQLLVPIAFYFFGAARQVVVVVLVRVLTVNEFQRVTPPSDEVLQQLVRSLFRVPTEHSMFVDRSGLEFRQGPTKTRIYAFKIDLFEINLICFR